MDAIRVFNVFTGCFAMFIIVFGTITNTIVVLVIVLRKNLRKTPTFVFIAFEMVIETIPLYFRNLNAFTSPIFGYTLDPLFSSFCQTNFFFHYFSLQSAAWILIAMSIERYLSIVIKTWRTRKFNAKKAVYVSSAIIVFFFVLNICLLFQPVYTVTTVRVNNASQETTRCVYNNVISAWAEFNTYIYSIIPFIILAIVNCLLIFATVFQKSSIERSAQEKAKRRSLTISVMAMTISYILLTAPSAIISGYFFRPVFSLPYGSGLVSFFSCLRFLYHSCNLVVLMIFNKKFALELKALIGLNRNNKVSNIDGTTRTAV